MTVAIIILNYNGLNDTLECLESVYEIDYKDFEVIVVDNGSEIKPKAPILKRFPQTTIFENDQNLGFAEGCNIGMRYALKKKIPYILLLNNDTVVHKNLLKVLVKAAQENKAGGIFGTKILSYYEKDKIDNIGAYFSWKTGQFYYGGQNVHKNTAQFCQKRQADYVCGGGFFIKSEVIEKIGLLENKFFLMWEEVDFCYRAKKEGFEIWTEPEAVIWHKISASFVGGKIHSDYFWWRGRLLWAKRNLSSKEKRLLYRRFFLKEIFKVYKLKTLKTIELYLLKYLTRKAIEPRKVLKVLRYKAASQGIIDYFLGHFGQGSRWIKNSKDTVFYQRFLNLR